MLLSWTYAVPMMQPVFRCKLYTMASAVVWQSPPKKCNSQRHYNNCDWSAWWHWTGHLLLWCLAWCKYRGLWPLVSPVSTPHCSAVGVPLDWPDEAPLGLYSFSGAALCCGIVSGPERADKLDVRWAGCPSTSSPVTNAALPKQNRSSSACPLCLA